MNLFDELRKADLTDSNPVLSAFHAMTGIPRNPAICKKYCEAAVERPNFSVFVKYKIAALPFDNCWHKTSVISEN